jgi:hypothetical protein
MYNPAGTTGELKPEKPGFARPNSPASILQIHMAAAAGIQRLTTPPWKVLFEKCFKTQGRR